MEHSNVLLVSARAAVQAVKAAVDPVYLFTDVLQMNQYNLGGLIVRHVVYTRELMWRRVLIDWPARVVEVGFIWYRLYLLVLLWAAGTIPLVTVSIVLLLWYGFGIRWGW